MRLAAAAAALLYMGVARAEVGQERAGAAGYIRVMTRPDFQGGDSRLGFWNLYGRLLNEGPYAALELRLDLVPEAATPQVWTSVHAKVEGGSVLNADPGRGWLGEYFLSQLYVKAGNILLEHVTWQLGTLYSYAGDLGLYDVRPSEVFFDTVGLSARYVRGDVDLLVGVGDAGYALKGTAATDRGVAVGVRDPTYNTVFTGGGFLRLHLSDHFELGGGGQYYVEPEVVGNRYAPHQTPLPAGIAYEDYYRGEVGERFAALYPDQEFPRPRPTSAESWKLVGYLGFGGVGPLRWSALHASLARLHPRTLVGDPALPADVAIYVHDFTDERYRVLAGNEMQLTIVPGALDLAWAVLVGRDEDRDNDIAASEANRDYASTVLRLQAYLTREVHVLAETSLARELSKNGNLWREHFDSIFRGEDGTADARGLEYGDTDRRFTWQGKAGVVLNPAGTGIYTRPSIRILYGLQYSNVHDAFGTSFVQSLADNERFPQTRDRHWHSVIALEAEAWF